MGDIDNSSRESNTDLFLSDLNYGLELDPPRPGDMRNSDAWIAWDTTAATTAQPVLDISSPGSITHAAIPVDELFNLQHQLEGLDSEIPAYPTYEDLDYFTRTSQLDCYDSDGLITPDAGVESAPSSTHHQSEGSPTTQRYKRGARFDPNSVDLLKTWFSAHGHHPYASAEDLKFLQQQTRLNKQQISTWLNNARRRLLPKSALPSPLPFRSPAIEILSGQAGTRGSPSFEHMNPLERWQNSPPDHEAVNESTIVNAVSTPGALPFDWNDRLRPATNDNDPPMSREKASSVSSLDTSHSSRGSSSSAYSYTSQSSPGFSATARVIKSRRRRVAAKRRVGKLDHLRQLPHAFQCTFCTETYVTKHCWQRHEKSMHLSLDQWVCSLHGSIITTEELGLICAYCGHERPNASHMRGHNHLSCLERSIEERTFYRKDHLYQHLKLVHKAKFLNSTMDQWKVTIENVRSRCGFCDSSLSSWADRIDHIAGHFKAGATMAEWKGNWGFDSSVLEMVENAVPPYLIHYERSTPVPYTAISVPSEGSISAYELIKSESEHYIVDYSNAPREPHPDYVLQYESCCIILGSEMLSQPTSGSQHHSWLRDLLMSSEDITIEARLQPVNGVPKLLLSQLRIHGKKSIFEGCNFELQLRQYAELRTNEGLATTDGDLQAEASNIVKNAEDLSPRPSYRFAEFLIRLIQRSAEWLAPFRRRTETLSGGERANGNSAKVSEATVNSIGGREYMLPDDGVMSLRSEVAGDVRSETVDSRGCASLKTSRIRAPGHDNIVEIARSRVTIAWQEQWHRRFTKELYRFVAMTMSPNNPNRHVPTDEELRYQARWIEFESDDPWNQTAADNPEWLDEFKRDTGFLRDTQNFRPTPRSPLDVPH